MVIGFPCSLWSTLRNTQKVKQAVIENQDFPFLEFAVKLARWQEGRGRLFVIESPAASRAWEQPLLTNLVEDYGIATFDMCTQGLKDPYRGRQLKRTGIVMSSDAVRTYLKEHRCACQQEHGLVLGRMMVRGDLPRWLHLRESLRTNSHRHCCEKRMRIYWHGRTP